MTHTFPGYHWIYWLGPVLGSLAAAGYYRFAKFFEYEDANPGQDDAEETPKRGNSQVREV